MPNDQGPQGTETQTVKSSHAPSYTIPETEFCVFGKVYAYPQHASALARVYQARNHPSRRLRAGRVIYYCISQEPEPEDTTATDAGGGSGGESSRVFFYFFEQYTAREAFDAHNRQPII